MATYAIGDVQGCFDELQRLLKKIHFNAQQDQLWFVGDLVNRGPKSLEVLRFIKNLPNAKVVLGNHDLHLLAVAFGNPYPNHTLAPILAANDRNELIEWLRNQPLMHIDLQQGYVMAHAGIYPLWNLSQAERYAHEFATVLQSDQMTTLLTELYGSKPEKWDENLIGWERLRFIANAFTRMRFCTRDGRLEFATTGEMGTQPEEFIPWFAVPERKTREHEIIFGHWAALKGKVDIAAHVYALDTGCVWKGSLTAMRLEDKKFFRISCQ
jgi:bis(5'-nucleosyl)-tetraphosphatase (symmetrical)